MPNPMKDGGFGINGKIPIIGAEAPKAEIHAIAIQMVVTCKCGSKTPILIAGCDRTGICASCKRKWVIADAVYHNRNGQCSMDASLGEWTGPEMASRDLAI